MVSPADRLEQLGSSPVVVSSTPPNGNAKIDQVESTSPDSPGSPAPDLSVSTESIPAAMYQGVISLRDLEIQ